MNQTLGNAHIQPATKGEILSLFASFATQIY